MSPLKAMVTPVALTPKQQRFVDAYDGNGTDAARKAGYKGNDVTLAAVASENLRKPQVAAAIRARESKRTAPHIATRTERQVFWTKVANDPTQKTVDRLRASELLGRSEADFTEKVEHRGGITLEQLVLASYEPKK